MSTAPKLDRLATYEDLLPLPEMLRVEVIAGQMHTQPGALPRHSRAQSTLVRNIGGPFDGDHGGGGPGGWWIFPDVDVRFGPHDIVRPDLSGWRRERLVDPWDTRPIEVVPDWICEVLSPSNAAHDRMRKGQLYARHGVPHYWLVDPTERTLEALVLEGGRWVLAGIYDDSSVVRVAPFEAVELRVTGLFPPLPPAAP